MVDLIIRDLDDETMLKMMAADNDDAYAVTPAFILETVLAAKLMISQQKAVGPGAREDSWLRTRIASLLGWPSQRIKGALAELSMIDAGDLSKKALIKLPHARATRAFHQEIKRAQTNNHPISLKRQEQLAEKIISSTENNAERAVKEIINGEV